MADKPTIRSLMATLAEITNFAAYHEAKNTQAAAASSLTSLKTALPEIREIGDAIKAEFETKAWDEEKAAARVVALLKKAQPLLATLADEERRAGGSVAKFWVSAIGHPIHPISAQRLSRDVDAAIKSEQDGSGKRPASYHAHNPISGIDFNREFGRAAATTAR